MPLLDTSEGRVIVRIVYDGLPFAGKTTNLRQLCSFFTPLRRGELYTPEERDGRTLFFDWLRIDGGVVGGYRLRCEMVTVPGQSELRHRRASLIRNADGIVFVCEGTRSSLEEARHHLAEMPALLGDRNVPVVIQANKQDAPGSLNADAIREVIGFPEYPLVLARAAAGAGVRETAVMAIRAVADSVQKYLLEHGPEALVGVADDPRSIYERMKEGPELVPNVVKPKVELPVASEPASLPNETAATGLVWPALLGRDILRRAAALPARLRNDLRGQNTGGEGSGKSDVFLYQAGSWCLKTSIRRRFLDLEDARAALVQLARTKLSLGDLLLDHSAATVNRDATDVYWLWTVSPWVVTIQGEMAAAAASGDQKALERALRAYADAVVVSSQLAAERGLILDVHPGNFAVSDGQLRYIDDDVAYGRDLLAVGHAIIRRVDEYRSFEGPVDQYVSHLGSRLSAAFPSGSQARDSLRDAIAGTTALTPNGAAARALLGDLLGAAARRRTG